MRSLAVYLKNYKKESILAPFFKFLEVGAVFGHYYYALIPGQISSENR